MCTFVLFSNSCSFCYSLVHIVRAIRFFFFHVNDLRIILLYFQFLVFFLAFSYYSYSYSLMTRFPNGTIGPFFSQYAKSSIPVRSLPN